MREEKTCFRIVQQSEQFALAIRIQLLAGDHLHACSFRCSLVERAYPYTAAMIMTAVTISSGILMLFPRRFLAALKSHHLHP